jgi:glucose-1-phosphate cytidylyltransferase
MAIDDLGSSTGTAGMKAVILAGGFGTRLSEETGVRPKPMVEIGPCPILWHILKIFSAYGVNDFIICCGYKGEQIKSYFANYHLKSADVTFDLGTREVHYHRSAAEPWRVTLVETGEATMTGGRLKRVREHIGDDTFFFTYGDGLSDVDLGRLLRFHREQGALATLTAVQPPGRFGAFTLGDGETRIRQFHEKPRGDGGNAWINGGFFVLEPKVIDYIEGDGTSFEHEPLEQLARNGQLAAHRHNGFWHPMDTLRDKMVLEDLWSSGRPPWLAATRAGPPRAEPRAARDPELQEARGRG